MGKKSAKVANGESKGNGIVEKTKKMASSVVAAATGKPNGKSKTNGTSKKEVPSDSESLDSESDDEESADSNSDSDSDSSKSEVDSDAEVPVKQKASKAKAAADSSDDDSSDADSDAAPAKKNVESDSESSDGSASEAESPSKKRKADVEDVPAPKKAKGANGGATAAGDANGGSSNGIKNLFVGNLSWNIDEEWLTREFESFGEIARVNIITDKNTGRSKGFGYVEFTSAGDAQKAFDNMKGHQLDGRELNVDFSAPRTDRGDSQKFKADSRAKSFGDQTSPESETLFVGNISFDADEDMLAEAFGEWGTVRGIRLPKDPESGNLKGFGYVEFSSVDEAKAALENMRGAEIAGRAVRLDFTQPRQNNGGDRGGFNRRGGGDFGGRGRGGGGRGRGGFSRGGPRGGGGRGGGRGGSYNRGGFGDFSGRKTTFD